MTKQYLIGLNSFRNMTIESELNIDEVKEILTNLGWSRVSVMQMSFGRLEDIPSYEDRNK